MLNRNIDSIIYQGYIKLGKIGYELANNASKGLEGTKNQKLLWNRAIYLDALLDEISDHIEVVDNSVYRIIGITEQEMNSLLSCLKETSEIYDFPVAPFIPSKDLSKITAGAALQGIAGQNGVNAYIAVGFAEDSSGTNFTTSPTITTTHVAFKTNTAPISLVAASFSGLWVGIKGNNGTNGTNGINGQNVYPYIRYASDASGTDFSATPSINRRFVAFLLSTTDLGLTPISSTFNGLWTEFFGQNGTNGTNGLNGKTIICGSGSPSNAIGVDGDVFLDTTNYIIYAPKSSGVWPAGFNLQGPVGATGGTGAAGSNGSNGTNAYFYLAWADDASGTGFTTVFDPNKDYIGTITSTTPLIPVVGDFPGFSKYRGTGDRWATQSLTSLTIGLGTKVFVVENNLAYTTGQRFVIATTGNPANRMEGYVIDYNPMNGQFTGDVTNIFGSGTFNIWDCNLAGIPNQIITDDSYFAEIRVEGGVTAQTINTTFVKITQFNVDGDVSGGMTRDHTTDQIIPGITAEAFMYAKITAEVDTGTIYEFQIFKDGLPLPGFIYRQVLASGSDITLLLEGLRSMISTSVYDLRMRVTSGGPADVTIKEAVFGMFTTGTPATPEYSKFGSLDFDIGTGIVIDAFAANIDGSGGNAIWDYKIKKGNNIVAGEIRIIWDGLGNFKKSNLAITPALGTIDVVLDADISGGNVRLIADITSDNWEISGNRFILKL
jgi:hypothetical protein